MHPHLTRTHTHSKDVLALGGSPDAEQNLASQRNFKLCRGIRVFASTYLQDNLLTLPSLPSPQQLAEIRERREREARERLLEIERQRELQRQAELMHGPAHAVASHTEDNDEDKELVSSTLSYVAADSGQTEKKNRFEKLKNFRTKVIPKVNFKRDGGVVETGRTERLNSGSGWMGTSAAFGRVDSQDDPFSLQHQQLLQFIEQAKAAGRMDEVSALEQSLYDIEQQMSERDTQRPLTYGFD